MRVSQAKALVLSEIFKQELILLELLSTDEDITFILHKIELLDQLADSLSETFNQSNQLNQLNE